MSAEFMTHFFALSKICAPRVRPVSHSDCATITNYCTAVGWTNAGDFATFVCKGAMRFSLLRIQHITCCTTQYVLPYMVVHEKSILVF